MPRVSVRSAAPAALAEKNEPESPGPKAQDGDTGHPFPGATHMSDRWCPVTMHRTNSSDSDTKPTIFRHMGRPSVCMTGQHGRPANSSGNPHDQRWIRCNGTGCRTARRGNTRRGFACTLAKQHGYTGAHCPPMEAGGWSDVGLHEDSSSIIPTMPSQTKHGETICRYDCAANPSDSDSRSERRNAWTRISGSKSRTISTSQERWSPSGHAANGSMG